jgi:hypothetical protein
LGKPLFCVVGAGAAGAVFSASRDVVFVLTATAPGRVTGMRFRLGVGKTATFTSAFGLMVFLATERAIVFFLVALPAAFAAGRAPALALAAFRERRFAVLGAAAFRIFAAPAANSVSSAVNRSLSDLISFLLRESAVVTSRIASLPSAIRK